MKILGISSQFHDAAITLIEDGEILFASHSERYSHVKNDPFLSKRMVTHVIDTYGLPDQIVFHEKNWAKKLRQLRSFDWSGYKEPSASKWIADFYPELKGIPQKSYWHHETHAAAGVLTSDFDRCLVMVIDAIGEFTTASLWGWENNKLKKLHTEWYPDSLGLFYTAVTARVGLKPMEDEYILMGMSAYGNEEEAQSLQKYFDVGIFSGPWSQTKGKNAIKMNANLHKGFSQKNFRYVDQYDLALAAQKQVEKRIIAYAEYGRSLWGGSNLVFMGGVALNCVANSKLFNSFSKIHIMPNPGDAGSSLGAAALHYHKQTGKKINWTTPYLGHNIDGPYPIKKALASLEKNEIFGIANGRAEFGPRALGNRSLMADPRGAEIKDRVNEIKLRQKFRPFAPVILEKYAHEYFELAASQPSPYMQFVARCKKPDEFPAIVHVDGTSRVQTVNEEQHPYLCELLTEFYNKTGCPMLLNTSLNIKGKPIVNDRLDAIMFEKQYGIPVHTAD